MIRMEVTPENMSNRIANQEPGGFPAISPGWRAAPTPGRDPQTIRIPEGCQAACKSEAEMRERERFGRGTMVDALRSLRDRPRFRTTIRGWAFGQPPANRSHPSGMAGTIWMSS